MNWRRGLLRLWLVASVCWLVVVTCLASYELMLVPWLTALEQQECFDEHKGNPALGNPFDCFDKKVPAQLSPTATYAFIGIAPVLSSLLLGLGGAWVWAGLDMTPEERQRRGDLAGARFRVDETPDRRGSDVTRSSMSRNRLTRWGLLLNGVGAWLLLICHFQFSLPSGYPPSLTGDYAPWAEFWQWTNLVGSVAGAALTVLGIILQLRAIAEDRS